jgi:hypothetical protein
LRCGHDEIHLAPTMQGPTGVSTYDPLEANTRWWDSRP